MKRTRSWRAFASLGSSLLALAAGAADAAAAGNPQAGSIEAGTLALPSAPGSVRGLGGSATVDAFTGQVGYQMPFELPAGPGGVHPSLALVYEGSLGNSPYGLGWGLSVPRLQRSTRLGVPDFAATDELELVGIGGGGRLIDAGDGTWRVEGQGQAVRIERPIGTDMYVVTDASGLRYLLGTTPATRQQSGTMIAAWYVQTVEHPSGQTIEWSYTTDGGQLYPQAIVWGPRQQLRADLTYEVRPDAFTSRRAGFAVTTGRRLRTVAVRSFGTVARTYTLAYSDALSLARLTSVTMTGVNGATGLPVLRFRYGTTSPATALPWTNLGGWHLGMADVTLMDVDGDGVGDLVRLDPVAGHTYRRNLAESGTPPRRAFENPRPLPNDTGAAPALSSVRLMDIQGDTAPDLVRVVGNEWWVQRLVNGQWSTVGTWANTAGVALRALDQAFADLDGDDRPDVLSASPPGLVVRMNGDGGLGAPQARPAVAPTAPLQPGAPGVVFRDFDGDGLADAALLRLTGIEVFPGRGDGTFAASYTITFPTTGPNPMVPANLGEIELADLNRDGVVDVIHARPGAVTWYPARPSGALLTARALAPPEPLAADVVVTFADGNGNGSEDVLWSSPRGFWVMDLAGATNAGMVTEIDSGLGFIQRFTYEASARLRLAAELDPALPDWAERLPISIPVAIRTQDLYTAVAPTRTSDLLVRDGFWDAVEKRFGGFLVTRKTEVGATAARTLVETTTYHAGRGATDRVLRGRPLRVERRDGTGRRFDEVEHTWAALALPALTGPDPRLRLPVTTRTAATTYEGAPTGVVTAVDYVHDADGNVATETRAGRTDRAGDETVVTRTWAHNPARWIRNLIVEERTEDGAGVVLARRRTRYDGGATALPAGQVDLGRPRVIEAWDGGAWVVRETLDYDAPGNPVRRLEGGVVRELGYDADAMFVTSETVRPGGAAAPLVWTAAWDPTLAVLVSVTDPSGIERRIGHDGVGRLASEALGAAPPHRTYAYAWTSPRPTTTTTELDGPLGTRTTRAVFDGGGRPLYQSADLGGGQAVIRDWVERDERGDVVLAAEPWVGVVAPTVRPASAPASRFALDATGRFLESTRPDGTTTGYGYEPLAVTEATEGTVPVRRERDGQGRLIAVDRTIGGTGEALRVVRDALGRAAATTQTAGPDAIGATYTYDLLGRLVAAADPDHGEHHYQHDAFDRLLQATGGEGRRVHYTYDDAGRLLSAIGDDGTAYRYRYDVPRIGPAGPARTAARLASVEEPTGVVDLAYDPAGRVATRTRTIAGLGATTTMTYAPSGRVRTTATDDGWSATYGYDAIGRLRSIGPWWTLDQADASGRPLRETAGNGFVTTTTRDALGRATAIEAARGGVPRLSLAITRDALGSPVEVADLDGIAPSHHARYGYDEAGRIVDAHIGDFPSPWGGGIPYELTYAWNGLQQLTAVGVSVPPGRYPISLAAGTYAYARDTRRLASITGAAGTTAYAHDRAGRVTTAGARGVSWDDFGRITRVDDGAGVKAEYAYGHDGERVTTDGSAGLERRYSADDVRRPDGTRAHYLRAGGQLVARVDRRNGLDTPVYFQAGVSSSPALVTAANGAVLEERMYEPFGASLNGKLVADPHGGINHPVDPDTGWSDAGARWYAGDAGQWTAPDPITRAPSEDLLAAPWRLNPYAYGRQNPMAFWDPDGREDAVYGWEPSNARAGYLYARIHSDERGVVSIQRGMGLVNSEVSPGVRIQLCSTNEKLGFRLDPMLGLKDDWQVFRLQVEPGSTKEWGNFGFELSFLSASVDAYASGKSTAVAAKASFAAISVSHATQDPAQRNDHDVRLGVSFGGFKGEGDDHAQAGAAFKLYYGDVDGDGVRELGFGATAQHMTVELRSEVLHAWMQDAEAKAREFVESITP